MTLQFYLEFIRDALLAANEAVAETARRRSFGEALGRGTFGDMTYEVDKVVEDTGHEDGGSQASRYDGDL